MRGRGSGAYDGGVLGGCDVLAWHGHCGICNDNLDRSVFDFNCESQSRYERNSESGQYSEEHTTHASYSMGEEASTCIMLPLITRIASALEQACALPLTMHSTAIDDTPYLFFPDVFDIRVR